MLTETFDRYSNWRNAVSTALEAYRHGIDHADVSDAPSHERISQMQARLADDRLSVAFVAEFSRGKSELINAIFFADYGQRILPSSAGRTTMCPTELQYDAHLPPCIRLLPIATRTDARSMADFRNLPEAWQALPLELASTEGMQEAFRQVSLTTRVPVAQASAYGLFDADDVDAARSIDADGMVEISLWRHAIVNFPHPLLKQGLVIIDTPGLNAIGSEPELTLNLIPNAHAVLFVLAADTGVTKSDIALWRDHIGSTGVGRMVVLNKIDSMWDALRTDAEVAQQIAAQAAAVAQALDLPSTRIYPVSAQKGLVAKIQKDALLLERSRLPALEDALSQQLIPARQDIVRQQLVQELDVLYASRRALIDARLRNVVEQLFELKSLRGKNQKIVLHMMARIDVEKKEFDDSLFKLQATRAVFSRLSDEVFTSLGIATLNRDIRAAREAMDDSFFSSGLRQAVRQFFQQVHANLILSGQKTDEIGEMMTVMYRKFSTEHGLAVSTPMPFSLEKYRKEIMAIDAIYQKQFGAAAILTTPQVSLMQKFFDSIASRVKQSFVLANRDVETWLKVVMAPLEAQIQEHKTQLQRRRQSIERVHQATDSLEEKVQVLESLQAELDAQKAALAGLEDTLRRTVSQTVEADAGGVAAW
ncbi:MAG: dynamin family protein [Herminiimonas sp.]|nr:dynamin family protein [Herminiimonas sp.]